MGRKAKTQEDKKGKLSITISCDNYEILVNEKINKSKLINWLLEQHFNSLTHGK
jgi:hypothetical protein